MVTDFLSAILAIACAAVFFGVYFGPVIWAVNQAQSRGYSSGFIVMLFVISGPLAPIVWLAARPSRLVDRSPDVYSTSNDALVAAAQLDQLGEWDAAIVLYETTAHRWPDHREYIARCIREVEEKRALVDAAQARRAPAAGSPPAVPSDAFAIGRRRRTKYVLAAAAIAVLLPAFCVGGYFFAKSSTIRSMDEKYGRVNRDDDVSTVFALFGEPHQVGKRPENLYWDDAIVRPNAGEVAEEYRYTVNTLYLPITWAFGVNEDGRVISKHRYD